MVRAQSAQLQYWDVYSVVVQLYAICALGTTRLLKGIALSWLVVVVRPTHSCPSTLCMSMLVYLSMYCQPQHHSPHPLLIYPLKQSYQY